jgi:hypothetical protein
MGIESQETTLSSEKQEKKNLSSRWLSLLLALQKKTKLYPTLLKKISDLCVSVTGLELEVFFLHQQTAAIMKMRIADISCVYIKVVTCTEK